MSLFTSLYTGASGMQAQTQSTAAISNNIANINTIGFKRSDTAFYDLVSGSGTRLPASASGAVSATRIQRVDKQGQIQQTASSTDVAISGNGFFAVKTNPDPAAQFFYTRNGTFGADAEGILRNNHGFALYGWQLDEFGNLPAVTNNIAGLTPVDVSIYDNAFLPTSQINLALNLNASAASYDPHRLGQTLPASVQATTAGDASQPANFARSVTVVDALGNPQQLTFEMRKIVGPMAHFTSGIFGQAALDTVFIPTAGATLTAGINNGDQFQLNISGGTTETYTFVDEATGDNPAANQIATMQGLLDAINAHGAGDEVRAQLTPGGQLLVRAIDTGATASLTELTGTPLSGAGTLNLVPHPISGLLTYPPETAYADQADYPAFGPMGAEEVHHWWEVRILAPADPSLTNPDPLAGQRIEVSKGLINFRSDGTLNTPRDGNDNIIAANINLAALGFDGSVTGEEIDITADISGFLQQAGGYNVMTTEQNGIEMGNRTGVSIDREGRVAALFSNGMSRDIYQIPIVTFINANGLAERSGTVFAESDTSGAGTLEQAGMNGAGILEVAAVEASNVDLGEEFAGLIVSQRAYGANSQTVKAANEMTQLLAQLKR